MTARPHIKHCLSSLIFALQALHSDCLCKSAELMCAVCLLQAAWGLKRPPGRVPPPACSLPYIPWGSLLPCPATPGANATPGPPQVQVQVR